MKEYYLGFDIGGTKCAAVLGVYENDVMTIQDKNSFPTETEKGWKYSVNNIFTSAFELLEKNSLKKEDIKSIGISCGGPLDSKKGVIMSPPNLPGWDNVPITQMCEEKFGVKAYLQNDANACGVAEWKFGAAKGAENAVFLTFGTGMGAGLILGGRLYEGTNGMAGEIGHIRMENNGPVGYGKEGSFEGFCSGGGIAQTAKTMVLEALQKGEKPAFCESIDELDIVTAKTVAEAAKNGDELAIKIYEKCGKYLGRGLSVLIDILNPEVIVIGSIYERSSELLKKTMQKTIEQEALSVSASVCRVVPAVLGDSIGDYAALAIAVDKQ